MVCCAAVMSLFFVSGILTNAASCSHRIYVDHYDALQSTYNTAQGHYEVRGTEHICTSCGHTYWTNVRTNKTGDHEWNVTMVNGNFVYGDCKICGWKR